MIQKIQLTSRSVYINTYPLPTPLLSLRIFIISTELKFPKVIMYYFSSGSTKVLMSNVNLYLFIVKAQKETILYRK